MVVDDEEKANILNTFFSTVFTVENEMLGEIPRNNENPILRVTNLTQEEVRNRLNKIKIDKSPGPDGIHPRVLRELSNVIDKPLFLIFRDSIATGSVPQDWRIANVVPIFKKGSKSEPGNYRPQAPRDDSWNMYAPPNPYQWHSAPPQNLNDTHYVTGGRSPWPGGDVQSPVYDVKDSPQNPGYHQRQFPGYPADMPQSCPPSEPKPNLPPPNPHYSSSPQIYNRKEPSNPESVPRPKEANNPPADLSSATHPGILKICQVLERVEDLEEEVDEFVGKKTDMSYRCLEEMLTKELLELDSVETGGQDGIRQARKEAVKKLQSILERLERKGL
ncbi:unnamed protein product [Ranitomeya imitator]|uniref:BAG domain-containing protein n=1 Tax=Ranitomeya imitator TaxID=111125 RepID=A0ABN9LQN9_9NEOB|nr:unnamed protein product [Ranitomeya imitator]